MFESRQGRHDPALYVKRGYIPDGRGIVYRGHCVEERAQVVADDDLIMHLQSEDDPPSKPGRRG